MRLILMIAVFIVGFLQPFQAGANATVARALDSRFQAGWINGVVNVVLLSSLLLSIGLFGGRSSQGGGSTIEAMRTIPWWAFLAGAIGASVVVVQLTAAPKLGAALLVAIFVGGTALGSLACDRFGLAGYERVAIPWERVVGMLLVVAGVTLVARPWAGED